MNEARRTLSSVGNAARLLKQFSSSERELGVTELAGRLGIGKSTVHRLLATLQAEQFVEQDPESGRYRLGLAIFELGAAASASTTLHQAVLMPMAALRVRTGETVHAAVLDGRQVVYVERLESPHTLRLFLEVGRRNDAHSTATGKCLLAHLDEARLTQLLDGWQLAAKTPHTVTDPTELRQQLRQVRKQGYAHNLHESEVGILSVAAPIRDARGETIAALGVAGPAPRMEGTLDNITRGVVEAAAMASRRYQASDRGPTVVAATADGGQG
jgi:IclR family transcriptional regulator, KDG regulon repressor